MQHLLPHFFIIGERKCGTSSLYRYLLHHPQVLPCKVKEPQFFTQSLWRIVLGWRRYQSLFPERKNTMNVQVEWPELDEHGQLFTELLTFHRTSDKPYITGEASANTFYYANPRVVRYFLPNTRLILMLRHPRERAYSHYRMIERFKAEGRKTQALQGFEMDMRTAMDQVQKGHANSILEPSLYVRQLERWLKIFPREQLFIIQTEAMEQETSAALIMEALCHFLGLSPFDFSEIINHKFNRAPQSSVPMPIAGELDDFFRPYVQALEDRLQQKMTWYNDGRDTSTG